MIGFWIVTSIVLVVELVRPWLGNVSTTERLDGQQVRVSWEDFAGDRIKALSPVGKSAVTSKRAETAVVKPKE